VFYPDDDRDGDRNMSVLNSMWSTHFTYLHLLVLLCRLKCPVSAWIWKILNLFSLCHLLLLCLGCLRDYHWMWASEDRVVSTIFGHKLKWRRSPWPRGLKRGSAAALLLGFRVRIPPGALVACSLFCQEEVSATGLSLVQRTYTEHDVFECDL